MLAKGACRNRLVGFASKVREPARSYPAPADLMPLSEALILQFSKLTGGKNRSLALIRLGLALPVIVKLFWFLFPATLSQANEIFSFLKKIFSLFYPNAML